MESVNIFPIENFIEQATIQESLDGSFNTSCKSRLKDAEEGSIIFKIGDSFITEASFYGNFYSDFLIPTEKTS